MTARRFPFLQTLWAIALLIALAAPAQVLAQDAASVRRGWNGPYGSVLDDAGTAALGQECLSALYDMRLDDARRVVDRITARHPDHPIGPFLGGLVTWWRILPDLAEDDRSYDDDFLAAMARTLKAADRLEKSGRYPFDVKFFRAAAMGFRGRLLSNRGSWFRAARDGREAMDLVFEIDERDPGNPDFGFGKAVYDYFAATIPEQFPIVKPLMLFFPDGDKAAGLAGLERAAEGGWFISTEALYFLLQIHYQYEPDYALSLDAARRLRARHPTNGFFHVIEGRVQTRWGRWAEAVPILADAARRYDAGESGYTAGLIHQALYYLGRSQVALGLPQDALATFGRLDSMTDDQDPETYFRVWGRLRTGMIHDAAGRREQAVRAYREVLAMKDRGDVHERAKRYIKTPYTG